ncbi:MAG: isochorismatase family protein [Methylobacillus sp.]|jgi:nicotinamidase-related amidase|nr:isochorismatase family protein [Methylobacillus sp.]
MQSSVCRRELSQLVIVDVQEKLCAAMEPSALAAVVKNCGILLQAARLLEIPVLHTEQYPQGLGATIADLRGENAIAKTAFSCADEPAFAARLRRDRPQITLAGMEAHICILQTALQLQGLGKQVFVVEDAVISRRDANKQNALARLRHAGVIVTNTESVVFEWLKVAEGDAFKQISKLVR